MAPPSSGLAKRIGFGQLFAIGFGTMIGVGWMLVAGSWVLTAGPGGAIIAFGLGAVAVLLVSLIYAEMGSAFPFSGGEIVYVLEGLGSGAAFLVGWLLALTYVAVCAFEVVASAWIVAVLAPATAGPVVYHVLGSDVTVGALVIGFGGLAALTAVNVSGGRESARFQNVATWLKVAATAVFVVAALSHGSEANRTPWLATDAHGGVLGPILVILATVPVWYGGFNSLPQALGEVADLRRIGRLSLIMAMTIVFGFVFFSLVILATASTVPRATLANSEFPVADALFAAFSSPWPGRVVLFAGLLGILTSWNASIFSGARILFSMGRARIIPAVFARVSPRFGSPAFAAVFIAGCAAPVALLGRNSLLPLLSIVGLSYATGYLLVALSLFRLRTTAPHVERPYRMPGHPYLTGAAVLTALSFVLLAGYAIWDQRTTPAPIPFVALAVWLLIGLAVWLAGARTRRATPLKDQRRLVRER